MFWSKKKKNNVIVETNKEIKTSIIPPPDKVNALRLRRTVQNWKDKHTVVIEMHLRRELICLMTDIDHELEEISMADTFFNLKKVNSDVIQPLFESWVSRESAHLIKDAQKELTLIHSLELEAQSSNPLNDINTQSSHHHLLDVGSAAAMGLGGLATIPVLGTLSITSTGGLFGFFAVSTISLPILGAGILAVGSLVAISGYKMSGVKTRAIKRYRDNLNQVIIKIVLPNINESQTNRAVPQKKPPPPSLSEILQSRIQASSDKIIGELDL